MRRLVSAAELDRRDTALEVGAGTGGLTDLLAAQARRVVSVEIDRDLFPILEDRFADVPNVRLLNVDVLERKHQIDPSVIEALFTLNQEHDTRFKLVANLPYHIATPLLMNLLLDYPSVERFVFTVQAEVGDRILAHPGSRAFGPLAILTQTFAEVSSIARLSPQVFWPQPEVDSVMIRMDRTTSPFDECAQLHQFAAFVRGVFEHRRKTLNAALRYVVDDDARRRIAEQFDTQRRPETFSREEWLNMFGLVNRLK